MAEIKHNFAKGKMNKDVDERLVSKGEYRDAMNVQVSTSEGSDVGTIQNILGNQEVNMPSISSNSICVGSIADEKNDAFYWLVKELDGSYADFTDGIYKRRDLIFEHKNNAVTHVFVDTSYSEVLIPDGGNPNTGDIVMSTVAAFNAVNVGDVISGFVRVFDGLVLTDETFTIISKNIGNNTINIGNYVNSSPSWVSHQQGEVALKVNDGNGVLNFTDNTITGINIIDDLLFWTDNASEPKVINIPRSIEGTDSSGLTHTNFLNLETAITVPAREEHITVIKKSPKTVLTVDSYGDEEFLFGTTYNNQNFLIDPNDATQGNMSVGDSFNVVFELDLSFNITAPFLSPGDIILLNPVTDNNFPNEEHVVSVEILNGIGGSGMLWNVQIVSIDLSTSTQPQEYNWAIKQNDVKRFKNIFPRYSYRYKYIDGEYSSFAPFTNVIFKPGSFKYELKEAYNIGMENIISKSVLYGYNSNLPEGVVSIDLLYKESNSPVVYTIDTLSGTRLVSQDGCEVKPHQIQAALPENQLLRPWDNVPRKALAQSITGSRIVYGNYLQNYTVDKNSSFLQVDLADRNTCDLTEYSVNIAQPGIPSLKSIRNYSLGLSYLDQYGRQTPVFTHKKSDISIPINKSKDANQIRSVLTGDIPSWATHYKVFVKETSNQYYNLAMERIYDAKDGNIWLAFPSSDRNKLDEETFLILKRGVEGSPAVIEKNRYKVLAIKNEAPEFITKRKYEIGSVNEGGTGSFPGTYFSNANSYPLPSRTKVIISKQEWDVVGLPLTDVSDIEVVFTRITANGAVQTSRVYDVVNFDVDIISVPSEYSIILSNPLEEAWLADPTNLSQPDPTLGIKIYQRVSRTNGEFDGRFFVKVSRDIYINDYVTMQASNNTNLVQVATAQLPFYYLADSNNPYNGDNTTGFSESDSVTDWDTNYGSSGTSGSAWFIDSAWYAGYFAPGPERTALNKYGYGHYYGSHSSNSLNYLMPNSNSNGFNKGIWTDGSGQTWIYLSYGRIESTEANVSVHCTTPSRLHTTADIGDPGDQVVKATTCVDWNSGAGPCTDVGKEALHEGLYDWEGNDDMLKHWRLGSSTTNPAEADVEVVPNLIQGSRFVFLGDTSGEVYTISAPVEVYHHLSHFNSDDMRDGYNSAYATWFAGNGATTQYTATQELFDWQEQYGHSRNRRITYRIPIDKDPTAQTFNPIATGYADQTTLGTIQFIEEQWLLGDDQVIPELPAVWETEPKDDIDIDIYYELDSTFPLTINNSTNYNFAPIGTVVTYPDPTAQFPSNAVVVSWENNIVQIDQVVSDMGLAQNAMLTFHRKDGSCVKATLVGLAEPIQIDPQGNNFSFNLEINPDVAKKPVKLSWFNCYSWGNGVESNRIRDDYNQVFIDKGAKASSTLDDPYEEEHRKYGLIYSGLYNSTSGVNNLNQFIQAEKITKDINPTYGSIQKLHARDSDLVTLCEDKVLKILSKKDALFNADGNPQLTATNRVLGQTVPFVGEFGISKNPESFSAESYRAYFTDKVRGSVMRLSMDGLTPISMHGMKDWFKDNLKLNNTIIGSYDDKKDEYNITLPITTENTAKSVTFKEDVKGWVSFKSFAPENGISCANEYYTFDKGRAWKHHVENVDRNNFYNIPNNSTFEVLLNDVPGSVKSFTTLNYEGSDSKIDKNLLDNDYYNLSNRKGWYVDKIHTDLETGTLNEFIEKEGKWFNYIKGDNIRVNESTSSILLNSDGSSTFDQASFAIQGLGILQTPPIQTSVSGCTDSSASNYEPNAIIDDGSCTPILYGCLEPSATNYYPSANADDGSCLWYGCTCVGFSDGCTNTTSFDAAAINYPGGIVDDGSCIAVVLGCTDPLAFNYLSSANVDDGSCVWEVLGCLIPSASNYNQFANTDDGTCTWLGCTEPLAPNTDVPFPTEAINYVPFAGLQYGIQDDGSCIGSGCTDPTANNYDAAAIYDALNPLAPDYSSTAGSCVYCDFTTPAGAYNGVPITVVAIDTTQLTLDNGVIEVTSNMTAPYQPFTYVLENSVGSQNFGSFASGQVTSFPNLPADTYTVILTGTPATCTYTVSGIVVNAGVAPPVYGCTDSTACNYDPLADTDQGCQWTTCAGCMDGNATNNATQANNNSLPCYLPGTLNVGNCSIGCGDGNDNTDYGNYCCTYVYGCTDSTANNFDPAAYIDDNSCTYNTPGCTDPTATNYNSLAIIDDGSCYYTTNGCTNSNACNYDVGATVDDGSCVFGFTNVMIGDPTTTDANGNSVLAPVFYDDINAPVTTVKHYIFDTAVPPGSQYPNTTYTTALPYYPADTLTENDLGLSFLSLAPIVSDQYGQNDKMIIELYKQDAGGNSFSLVHTKDIVDPSFFNLQGLPFGDRVNSLPYGFGGSFGVLSLDDTNNYEFEIYQADGITKQFYAVQLKSEINGVVYGDVQSSTPNCGIYKAFDFTTLSTCDHPSTIVGCTDPLACNYVVDSTCEDGSCTYGTSTNYMWGNDPTNASQNICQLAPCGFAGSIYSGSNALIDCCTANNSTIGPCPTN